MAENPQRILVVAAHPDDEVFGCGATLAKHSGNGDKVMLLVLSHGEAARGQNAQESERQRALVAAAQVLDIEILDLLDFPDNQFDSVSLIEIVQAVEAALQAAKPHIVYCHHAGDLNIDHRLAHQAVMTACRPLPESMLEKILSFEVMSATHWQSPGMGRHFCPNYFVEVSDWMAKKRQALRAYGREVPAAPHARSIPSMDALATHRGHSVGLGMAEAFQIEREICR